jgi:hypothetical protein
MTGGRKIGKLSKRMLEYLNRLDFTREIRIFIAWRDLGDKQKKFFKLFERDCDEYYRLLADSIRGNLPEKGMDELDLEAEKISTQDRINQVRKNKDEKKIMCLAMGIPQELLDLTDPL